MRDALVIQISAQNALPLEEVFARIGRAGPGFAVQLRDPQLSGRALLEAALELRRRCDARGCRLIVNDRIDVAKLARADGIHGGRHSFSPGEMRRFWGGAPWLSRSAHDLDDVRDAIEQGVDAVMLSPVFSSPGKGQPLGIEPLRQARAILPEHMRLIALGGISLDNAASCFDAGADAVASIRADLSSLLGAIAAAH